MFARKQDAATQLPVYHQGSTTVRASLPLKLPPADTLQTGNWSSQLQAQSRRSRSDPAVMQIPAVLGPLHVWRQLAVRRC